jgi:hypothetical protein
MCLFNGEYLGAKSDGIFGLSGADDAGTGINGSIQTASIDAAKGHPRVPEDAWVAGRKGNMRLSVIPDEDTTYNYDTQIIDTKVHEERVKIGRGIKGRFFSFKLTNLAGTAFDITSLRVLVKRIRRAR